MNGFKRIQCFTVAGSLRVVVEQCKPNGSVIRSRGYDNLSVHSRSRLRQLCNRLTVYPYFYQDEVVVTIVGNPK